MTCIDVERSFALMKMAEGPCERAAQIAADMFNATLRQIRGPRRHRHIVHARWFAMWAAYQTGQVSYCHIARYFGDRDHSSVIHGVQQVEEMMAWRMAMKATGDQMLQRMGLA